MSNVEDIRKNKPEWITQKIRTVCCEHEYVAVYHMSCTELECPKCGDFNEEWEVVNDY